METAGDNPHSQNGYYVVSDFVFVYFFREVVHQETEGVEQVNYITLEAG